MKKMSLILAVVLVLMMVVGMFGVGHALNGAACQGPVDVDCTVGDPPDHCDIYVQASPTGTDCNDLPS
jgi:hypothetical protein